MGCGFQTAFLLYDTAKENKKNDRHTVNDCFIQGANF